MPRKLNLAVLLGLITVGVLSFGLTAGAQTPGEGATEADLLATEKELANIRIQQSAAEGAYANATNRLTDLNNEIAAITEELAGADARLAESQGRLSDHAQRMYISGSLNFVDIVFDAEDVGDLITRMELLATLMLREQEQLQELRAARDGVAAELKARQALLDQRAVTVSDAETFKAEAEAKEAASEEVLASLSEDLREQVEENEARRAEEARALGEQAQEDLEAQQAAEEQLAAEQLDAAQAQELEAAREAAKEAAEQAALATEQKKAEQQAAEQAASQAAAAQQARQDAKNAAAAEREDALAAAVEAEEQARLAAQEAAAAQEATEQAQQAAAERREAARQALAEQAAAAEEALADEAATAQQKQAAEAQKALAERAARNQAVAEPNLGAPESNDANKIDPASGSETASKTVPTSGSEAASKTVPTSGDEAAKKTIPTSGDEAAKKTTSAPPASASGSAVIQEALTYMGTPYIFEGPCERNVAVDCSCFTMLVFAKFGIVLQDDPASQYGAGTPVDGEPLAGDLVFWNEDGSGITHVGIATGNGTTIHASAFAGYVTETDIDAIPGYVGAVRVI